MGSLRRRRKQRRTRAAIMKKKMKRRHLAAKRAKCPKVMWSGIPTRSWKNRVLITNRRKNRPEANENPFTKKTATTMRVTRLGRPEKPSSRCKVRERESNVLQYGSRVEVEEKDGVEAGQRAAKPRGMTRTTRMWRKTRMATMRWTRMERRRPLPKG